MACTPGKMTIEQWLAARTSGKGGGARTAAPSSRPAKRASAETDSAAAKRKAALKRALERDERRGGDAKKIVVLEGYEGFQGHSKRGGRGGRGGRSPAGPTCKRIVTESGEGWTKTKWRREGPAIPLSTWRKLNPGVSLRGLKRRGWLKINEGAGGLFRVRCSR